MDNIDTNIEAKNVTEIGNVNLQQNSYFQDSAGNPCLRRKLGTILVGMGLAMGLVLFGWGLHEPGKDFETSYQVFTSFLLAGGSLVGINVVENIKGLLGRK
jgi:hypothetical protein